MRREGEVRDRTAVQEMLLDDPLDVLRRRVPVPGAFRVHEHDRPLAADPEAIRARAQDTPDRLRQADLAQALLEVLPGGLADFLRRAVAVGAEKDVAGRSREADLGDGRLDRRGFRVFALGCQSAASSISLVRIRTTRSIVVTKILPSPTLPVFA